MAPKAKAAVSTSASKSQAEPEPPKSAKGKGKGAARKSEAAEVEREPEAPKKVADASPVKTVVKRVTPEAPIQKSSPRRQDGKLDVSYERPLDTAAPLSEGLVQLRRSLQLCDAALLGGGGVRISVHRVVLASQSMALHRRMENEGCEVDLGPVSRETVDTVVKWIYGEMDVDSYCPTTTKVNEEVLRLSSELGLPKLSQICASRLAADVTVKNIVERVRLCEEFGLPDLRSALVSALVQDRAALDAVARDAATLQHPALMRELLAAVATKSMNGDLR